MKIDRATILLAGFDPTSIEYVDIKYNYLRVNGLDYHADVNLEAFEFPATHMPTRVELWRGGYRLRYATDQLDPVTREHCENVEVGTW